MPNMTPMIRIFLAMSIINNIVCNPMDNSLQMNVIHSNTVTNEGVHESLGISGLQNEAFVPQEKVQEPCTIADFVTSGQNSLGKINSSSDTEKSKGKKLFRFDLNLRYEPQCTEEDDREPKRRKINDCRETDKDILEVETPDPDQCQYSSSSDSMGLLGKKNEQSRVRGKASGCMNSVSTEPEVHSSTTTKSQSQQGINQMFGKMIDQGRQVGSQTGLGNQMKDWFKELKKDIASKHVNSAIFKQELRKIFRTISKAYRHVTLVFLGSLQVIHSTKKEEMQELVHDGWAFIVNYMEVWRWIDLENSHVPAMDVKPEELEIENPLELWHYLMGLARTSRISVILLWRLCNHWYHLSSYKDKMMIKTPQDLHVRWHYHLAKANLLSDWEIEPPATIFSLGQSSLETNMINTKSLYRLIRKENFSVADGRTKRFVGILREVGKKALSALNLQQSPFEFLQTYCQKMKNKNLQLPQEWKGNFESLKQKTMFGMIPCFLGMIHLLHPIEVSKDQPNPAVLDGLKFMQVFLKGWEKDDLEKAFRTDPIEIRRLARTDDPSTVLLAYLMNLKPSPDHRLASKIFWQLFQVWQRWQGSGFLNKNPLSTKIDFDNAIQMAYADFQ
ncbi:uncharacterized protein MELLADRAFT_63209 [Melampsora larici-populina 98AG31]|uniref:Secreted protein n=1 Tax=Melampsora larici-populina (strain 98AG31 / pathotype 3-4-7) TaxID=747676 RepID=F4RLU1_MELLP|nr:uncharacterized protein MELLADRAFT_63209 [Melampsora larici-populina 98AG31]EGG06600.1 hypothetical protein MELLADRAFT_63209 [Melampsora larici-populina 98AG31]